MMVNFMHIGRNQNKTHDFIDSLRQGNIGMSKLRGDY